MKFQELVYEFRRQLVLEQRAMKPQERKDKRVRLVSWAKAAINRASAASARGGERP